MPDNYQLTLATDLDGTFLEGDNAVKSYFYQELTRLRQSVMLIYVTGRPIETVDEFCTKGYLPTPHYILGDHGTRIVEGHSCKPLTHLQQPIIKKWNNGNQKLKLLLQDDPGIELQPIDPPYRVAYYYDPKIMRETTVQKIIDAGYDAILSCDVYLDIVPKDVNKGTSLINLINDLRIDLNTVITSGDSLNDLSLFQTGLKSIAVGNSEPKLITAIKKLKNVYHSAFPGLLGIIDGLRFHEQFHLFEN